VSTRGIVGTDFGRSKGVPVGTTHVVIVRETGVDVARIVVVDASARASVTVGRGRDFTFAPTSAGSVLAVAEALRKR
jgi:hypothetical protein